ncbi:MAG: FAD-dependent oxidoreductase [Burkholderiales bacterium PBB3]|nr:MAG: FAD-dependent oxidoreductase [Burkholderiales bacterium PBB3]
MQTQTGKHVVIIGCGFGGLEAAKALHHADVNITLIDRSNHHLFQPLLYQVATAGLSAPAIAAPIRHLFRKQANVTTLLGDVVAIDAKAQTITLQSPGTADALVPFDHLIVAAGATHSYFGNDQWEPFAPGLKTLADAMELRKRILFAFEAAEHEPDPALREALLTFAVIGGGPTGVEMAGTMAEIARHTLPGEFRRINPASAKVLLVEGGMRVLQAMPPELSTQALKQLEKLGVKVMLGRKVTDISADAITFSTGEGAASQTHTVACKTVVWAAGVAASPLGRQLAQATGCEVDRAGRVAVDAHLNVPGFPRIWVIGDMASATSTHRGQVRTVPGVSPAAKQMGRCAAANIVRGIQGKAAQAFVYADYGNLATIGRNAAVVDLASPLGQFRFSGYFAWLFWLFAHIYFLIGFRNRFVVLLDWASAYATFARHARVVVGRAGRD